jgi:hypothetical protein
MEVAAEFNNIPYIVFLRGINLPLPTHRSEEEDG